MPAHDGRIPVYIACIFAGDVTAKFGDLIRNVDGLTSGDTCRGSLPYQKRRNEIGISRYTAAAIIQTNQVTP